jgi:hypothetical protein
MSSVIDLEAQQVALAAPHAGAFFFNHLQSGNARKEEVEGAEAHEMDTLGPHPSGVASLLQSVSVGQNINGEVPSAVPHVEGVTSIWPGCRIPRRLYRSVTGSGASDTLGIPLSITNWNTDPSSSHTFDSHARLISTNAQSCAYFITIVDIPMT